MKKLLVLIVVGGIAWGVIDKLLGVHISVDHFGEFGKIIHSIVGVLFGAAIGSAVDDLVDGPSE